MTDKTLHQESNLPTKESGCQLCGTHKEEVQYSFTNILIPSDVHYTCFLHYCEVLDSLKFLGIEKDWVVLELDSR